MSVTTASGSTVSMSIATPATQDQAGYEALTYTVVGEVISGSALGGTINNATYDPLSTEVTQNVLGNKTMDAVTLQLAYNSADAGQILLESVTSVGDASYKAVVTFKFELPNGETYYSFGFVSEYKPNLAGANDLVDAAATFMPNAEYTVV